MFRTQTMELENDNNNSNNNNNNTKLLHKYRSVTTSYNNNNNSNNNNRSYTKKKKNNGRKEQQIQKPKEKQQQQKQWPQLHKDELQKQQQQNNFSNLIIYLTTIFYTILSRKEFDFQLKIFKQNFISKFNFHFHFDYTKFIYEKYFNQLNSRRPNAIKSNTNLISLKLQQQERSDNILHWQLRRIFAYFKYLLCCIHNNNIIKYNNNNNNSKNRNKRKIIISKQLSRIWRPMRICCCIIRLISLKRFLQIPTIYQKHKQQLQQQLIQQQQHEHEPEQQQLSEKPLQSLKTASTASKSTSPSTTLPLLSTLMPLPTTTTTTTPTPTATTASSSTLSFETIKSTTTTTSKFAALISRVFSTRRRCCCSCCCCCCYSCSCWSKWCEWIGCWLRWWLWWWWWGRNTYIFAPMAQRVKSQILMLAKCIYNNYYSNNDNNNGNGKEQSIHVHVRLPVCVPLMQRVFILCLLLSTLWHSSECFHGTVKLSTNTVRTKYGLLRGIVVRSTPLVEAYLGIPYASPPMGSLRFMPPITPSTWKNIRNADRFSAVCPQTVPIPPNGPEALLEVPRARLAQLRRLLPLLNNQSEDCLYLNIYVPYENQRRRRRSTATGSSGTSSSGNGSTENSETGKLATVLFIHGESYEWNSGNPYDGSELAAHGDVIVVTINFRLGIFGFLKTGGKESAQGNFGLMDLVAGLHWLKENLPAFGGDPQCITLIGHGSGAALANILVVSPVASDLVQRTVLVSGSALSPWAIQKNPLMVKRRVAEQTGCHGDMLYDDLAPCLRTKTVAELLAVNIEHPRFLVGFAPFIDGTVISPNTHAIGALTLPLGSTIVSTSGIEFANFPKRDLIFCLTSVESYLDLSAQDLEFGFNETRRDRILRTFVRNNYHYHLNEIFAVLKNEYTDWEKAIRNPLSSRDATLSFLSDGHTASALIKLGYMHSLRGGRSFFLHFKHKTVEEEYPQRTGSVRGEDVPFWLGLPVSPLFPHNYTTQERQLSRLMLRYLANFAKTGNPNQSTPSTTTSAATYVAANYGNNNNNNIGQAKVKRFSQKSDLIDKFLNLTAAQDSENAAAREALSLAVLYNQRRSNAMRERRTSSYRRRMRSNDDSNYGTSELNMLDENGQLPFWDAYDVVNQLYLELGNKAEVQSHYRGHKLSMWLNLIPQLHKHSNINDQSMRHHQFPDEMNSRDLYEGIVRPQMQTKPVDDENPVPIIMPKATLATKVTVNDTTNKSGIKLAAASAGTTTECGIDGAMFVSEITTQSSTDNRSLSEHEKKDLATASTGLIGNLEVLRRLSGKPFQSYTTALVATVAVGCFLLILNVLIFAGIYHQREKRARDAKTKEELQDTDSTSKNSSILKLNTVGLSMDDAATYSGAGGGGMVGKTTVIFGEYNCYDEKSKQAKEEQLMVDMQSNVVGAHMLDGNWTCSTSTLDLLKTKHHHPSDVGTFSGTLNEPDDNELRLHDMNNVEMASYNVLPLTATGGGILDGSKRNSFSATSSTTTFDYAVQSSEQMCFKEIEAAVKASSEELDNEVDDDIPEPPPPPRSYQAGAQTQAQQQQQVPSGSGGGILRPSGTGASTSSGAGSSGGKKRVHIQEISV